MRKDVIWIALIHYTDCNRTILYIFRVPHDEPIVLREVENPTPRRIEAIARAVRNANFVVRPFLAGAVGWVARRRQQGT